MKCKQCNQEYEAMRATSQYCSATCRQQARRLSVTEPGEVSVTEVSVTQAEQAATRTNPDLLNYDKPMSLHQLDVAKLKANRVPIPGDADYTGCCEQVDGQWRVRA